jgi:hypothetical protein
MVLGRRIYLSALLLLVGVVDAQESIFNSSLITSTDSPTASPNVITSTDVPSTDAPVAATDDDTTTETTESVTTVRFDFRLITRVTQDLPDVDAAVALVESGMKDQLSELESTGLIAFTSTSVTTTERCADFDRDLYPSYDECHEAQATVSVTTQSTVPPMTAQSALVRQVQVFFRNFNDEQSDIILEYQSPIYTATNLHIVLVGVFGPMGDVEMEFFEELLFKTLAPIVADNDEVAFNLTRTEVLIQNPYDPTSSSSISNTTSRRRVLQGLPEGINTTAIGLGGIAVDSIPFNDMQVFVQATCADMECTQENLDEVLLTNSSAYVESLAASIELNKQLILSQYFDMLFAILIVEDPKPEDMPSVNQSFFLDFDDVTIDPTQPVPSWIWVLSAVIVGVFIIAAVWLVVQSTRRATREREELAKVITAIEMEWQ